MNDNHELGNWFSLEEAAGRLGSTPLHLLMHIKRGLLVGREREDGWWIESDSLAELIGKRGEGEAPAVCQSGCARKSGGCGSCG